MFGSEPCVLLVASARVSVMPPRSVELMLLVRPEISLKVSGSDSGSLIFAVSIVEPSAR